MGDNKRGPREYKETGIPGAVIIRPKIYHGLDEGWLADTIDFTEACNFLGYHFESRCAYALKAPKGVIRGGHLESRSKIVTIVSGLGFYVLVDMRPGDTEGKAVSFLIGDEDKAWARSVIVPEGVVDATMALSDELYYFSVADKPYNAFDSQRALDLYDPDLGIEWPGGSQPKHDAQHRPGHRILKLKDFLTNR